MALELGIQKKTQMKIAMTKITMTSIDFDGQWVSFLEKIETIQAQHNTQQ